MNIIPRALLGIFAATMLSSYAAMAVEISSTITDTNLCTRIRGLSSKQFRASGGMVDMTIRNNDVYYIRNVIIDVDLVGEAEVVELPPRMIRITVTDLIPPGTEYHIQEYLEDHVQYFNKNPLLAPRAKRILAYDRIILPRVIGADQNDDTSNHALEGTGDPQTARQSPQR